MNNKRGVGGGERKDGRNIVTDFFSEIWSMNEAIPG